MPKYHRFLKDGYVVPFNAELVGNPLYQEFEVKRGEEPNDPKFLAVMSDEDAEEQEAKALEKARALIAKADAKAAEAKAAARTSNKPPQV